MKSAVGFIAEITNLLTLCLLSFVSAFPTPLSAVPSAGLLYYMLEALSKLAARLILLLHFDCCSNYWQCIGH